MTIKFVSKVDGVTVKRPSSRHPNPDHWQKMQADRRATQTVDGRVHCGTCHEVEGGDYRFELHHRHYDTFGNERIEDVILLCVPCHDAITARIRSGRFAAGDVRVEIEIKEHSAPRYVPQSRCITVNVEQKDEPARSTFRPTSRNHG